MRYSLTDLDELVLSVRDQTSRRLIQEAVTVYRSGAVRAAVVTVWIAVAYDILSKLRELSTRGDRAASELIARLDAATAADNVVSQQKIEASLLEESRDRFEFLSAGEAEDLERLRKDRHRCAHPAFASETSLFTPTPEIVRAHIVHSILHLLAHPPVQGKAALERVKQDLLQPSFPTDQERATGFLRAKYLDRAKQTLVESLVTVLLKGILRHSDPDLLGHEHAIVLCLISIKVVHPSIYASQMSHWLPRLTEDMDDKELARVFLITSADPGCWNTLDQPTRSKLTEAARAYDVTADDGGVLVNALSIDDLKPSVLAALEKASPSDRGRIIAAFPRPELAELAIDLYAESEGWRRAEWLGSEILLPMAQYFTSDQVCRVLNGVAGNGQIYHAGGSPEILSAFYDRVGGHLEATASAWHALMQFLLDKADGPEDHYAYPALRLLMERDGIWPLLT